MKRTVRTFYKWFTRTTEVVIGLTLIVKVWVDCHGRGRSFGDDPIAEWIALGLALLLLRSKPKLKIIYSTNPHHEN